MSIPRTDASRAAMLREIGVPTTRRYLDDLRDRLRCWASTYGVRPQDVLDLLDHSDSQPPLLGKSEEDAPQEAGERLHFREFL